DCKEQKQKYYDA
ncbi:hypothetical protein V3C99_008268, partial [Haemonchus contortus]